MLLEAIIGYAQLLWALILKHHGHLMRWLITTCRTIVVKGRILDSIVKHLPLCIWVCHVLSDWATHRLMIITDQPLTTTCKSAWYLNLVCIHVGVTHELPHDPLLLTEVTRSTDHWPTTSVAALLRRSVQWANSGGSRARSGSWLMRCRIIVILISLTSFIVLHLSDSILSGVLLTNLAKPCIRRLVQHEVLRLYHDQIAQEWNEENWD